MTSLRELDDDSLLRSLHGLMGAHRRVTAGIVAHLAEFDGRRLPQARGFSSLFDYCVKELRFSEDEAYRSALLKPHIDDANARELFTLVTNTTYKHARETGGALPVASCSPKRSEASRTTSGSGRRINAARAGLAGLVGVSRLDADRTIGAAGRVERAPSYTA